MPYCISKFDGMGWEAYENPLKETEPQSVIISELKLKSLAFRNEGYMRQLCGRRYVGLNEIFRDMLK